MSDVVSLLGQIEDTGRDTRGLGYQRPGFSATERELRDWFLAEAARRGLDTEIDANGITWAWATPPGDNAVVTGSHLDDPRATAPTRNHLRDPVDNAGMMTQEEILETVRETIEEVRFRRRR